jgi:hypothetical protein
MESQTENYEIEKKGRHSTSTAKDHRENISANCRLFNLQLIFKDALNLLGSGFSLAVSPQLPSAVVHLTTDHYGSAAGHRYATTGEFRARGYL